MKKLSTIFGVFRGWKSLLAAVGAVVALSLGGAQEAKAQCVFDVDIGIGNCAGNGTTILPAGFGTLYIGAFNGSGNANAPGFEQTIQIFETGIGIANSSGNANIGIGLGGSDPDALNVSILNSQVGIGNGSGNANVLFSDDDFNDGFFEAVNIQALNNHFGILNGSLNGNNLVGTTFVVSAENTTSGIGNLSLNANRIGCEDTDDDGDIAPLTECTNGSTSAIIVNNQAFGNLNGSGNANSLGQGDASLLMTNNTLFGNLNASGNGNGQIANAEIQNNFIAGEGSATANGNGGDSGNAVIEDNFIIGSGSASNNGNDFNVVDEDGDGNPDDLSGTGSAVITGNAVIGSDSLSDHNDLANDGTVTIIGNTVFGSNSANRGGDEFNFNTIIGSGSGNDAGRNVTQNTVIGDDSGNGYADNATGNLVYGDGSGNGVNGVNNIAIGNNAGNHITANNSIALGTNAQANGNSGIAIGDSSFAAGPNDTALGAGAQVTADHSTALGAGAVADKSNLVAIGTQDDTYRTPGITSDKSRQRQSGPLEVVTSDASGNLATDGGQIFRRLDENEAGTALAMSMENPDLTGNERFGIAANWGVFEDANALSVSMMGVLGHDWITKGDRVAVSGGVGTGFADNRGDDVWGGRVGVQWTWGRTADIAAAPMK